MGGTGRKGVLYLIGYTFQALTDSIDLWDYFCLGFFVSKTKTVNMKVKSYVFRIVTIALCFSLSPLWSQLSVTAGIAFHNTCNGASSGSVSVYPSGGSTPYSYAAIDPSNNTLSASSSGNDSAVFSSLAAGAYQVIVTDNNSDTASVWMTVTQPSALGGSSSNTNVSCNGGSDGLAIISGSGGVSPYSYKIGNGTYQTNDSFGTLSAGQYLITIVDQNICTDTFSIYITEPTALSISKTAQTNLTCAADSNGSVTLASTGGTTPYQFTVDSLSFQSSGTFTGLTKQSYTSYIIDANGCSQSLAFTITHLDNVDPTASARNNTVYLSAAGAATLVVDSIDNGSSDNCGIQSKAADVTSFSCSDLGVNLVVLTITDLDGNTDTAHAYVTVADTIYPQVTGLASINSYLNANGEDTIHVNDVVTSLSDNCGVASYYISDSTFTCSDTGANMVQIIVVDASGNTTAIDLVVNVSDTLAPTVMANNQILYLDASGAASLTLADVNNGSYDNCGIADMWMTDSTFTCADTGTSTIQLYATDAAGNSSFANVSVTVYDTLAPVILAKSVTVYLNAAGTASISVSGIDTGSYDNCGIDSQYLSNTNFTCTDTGSNSVTYTVKDAAGNTSTATLSIQVIDSILPTLSVQNLVLYLDSFGKAYTHVDSADNGTFDNCGIASLTLSQDTFDCSHVGDNTITFTATDKNNNQNSTTLTITVYDTLAPTLVLQQDTVYLDTAAYAFIVDTDIIAYSYDNCGIDSVLISQTEFGLGDTSVVTVWVTLKDKNGNQTGPDSVLVYVMISDSDSDGIMDYLEGGGDNDGDGVNDYLDLDSDNDGLLDFVENDFQDFKVDSDVDGTPDYLDLDSDGDGIFDVFETDGVDGDVDGVVGVGMPMVNSQGVPDSADNGLGYTPVDTDNDGIYDFKDLDTDDDGIADATERGATAIPVDTDGDGIRDWRDTDSDNDGIADATEGSVDTDGDGVGDWRDTDSDDDGIADSIEGTVDTDGDGTPDYLDLDSDNDGISDQIETNVDTDGDGTGDWRDTDSDNDGISDATEGTVDTDGDGTGDWRDTDSDNDGISDATEGTVDTDGDGTGDWRDTDSDNDGIDDATEGTVDTDGDGTGDWRDTDSDNDGISDATEGTVDTDGDGTGDWRDTDSDNDGISDATEGTVDTDGDGTGDWRDLDSDNDGIDDATEGTVDTDGDGTGDWRDTDSDDDGILDSTEGTTDTDGDGVGDWRDTDSDDDGIDDSIEGTTDTDGDGTGDWRDRDSDDDGIDDAIEGTTDTDGDGTGDWRDTDSDGDGIDDATEGTTDTDGDGTGDWRDTDSDDDGIDDSIEGTTDTDGDGTGDWRDTDSDNDGIDDSIEGTTDTDGDGTGDWRDTDSDDDGIDDATEGTTDTDGDGTGDWRDTDSDNDGIDDSIEGTTDTDGDGTGDWRDTDSDNDGIDDATEGTTDTDGDGTGDWRDTDSDNDGIDDATEGTTDTDGDGVGNWRDTDSDNDEVDDATEGTADRDKNGIPDYIDAQVFIPEGFSPNGDGDNDIFYIKGLKNYTQAEFIVFNRWGQIVFESGRGYNNQWDAKYRGNAPTLRAGETLPEDVYFFVFRYNGNDGKSDVSGNIYIKP